MSFVVLFLSFVYGYVSCLYMLLLLLLCATSLPVMPFTLYYFLFLFLLLFLENGFEMIIAQSYAKVMGLYGERTGALHVVCHDKATADKVMS